MSERVEVRDETGKIRYLQSRDPVWRPEGAEPDCAYCTSKPSCSSPKDAGASYGKRFFIGQKYPICGQYKELNEVEVGYQRLKELGKIFDSTPRPEGATKDCLFCWFLPMKLGATCRSGPWQGRQKVCDNYAEIPVRRNQPHCIFCLRNSLCPNDRVMRGETCGDYLEIPVKLEGDTKHCLFCLGNWNCTRDRVMRDGMPCEKYAEFDSGKPGKQ